MPRITQFRLGVQKLLQGFSFLLKHPRLWPWALLPFLIALFLLAIGFKWFLGVFPEFHQFLETHLGIEILTRGEGVFGALLYGLLWGLKQLLKPFLFLFGLILLSIATYIIYAIVSAPFLDLLSEKVTSLVVSELPHPFSFRRFFKSVGQSILIEIQKGILFLFVPLIFWFLNLIPGIGNFLYLFLVSLFGLWTFGFASIDYPMALQLLSFKERISFGLRFKYALMGLGLPLFIPFAPLLFSAPLVVGGTLLYHELKKPEYEDFKKMTCNTSSVLS